MDKTLLLFINREWRTARKAYGELHQLRLSYVFHFLRPGFVVARKLGPKLRRRIL